MNDVTIARVLLKKVLMREGLVTVTTDFGALYESIHILI